MKVVNSKHVVTFTDIREKVGFIGLGDSFTKFGKKTDFFWKGLLFKGNIEKAKSLKKGDTITIISGESRIDNGKGEVVIYEFDITVKEDSQNSEVVEEATQNEESTGQVIIDKDDKPF